MIIDQEWLSRLAEPKAQPEYKTQPWTVQLRGEPWTVVTNGQLLLMVKGGMGFPPGAGDWVNGFLRVASDPVLAEPVRLSLPALRQFCGFPEMAGPPRRCETCGGSRTVECPECLGEYEDCTCPHCGALHERRCARCRGLEELKCPQCGDEDTARRPALFGKTYFDRNLLGRALMPLSDPFGEWRHGGGPTRAEITGDGWALWIMPLRGPGDGLHDAEYVNAPVFPPLAETANVVEVPR